MSASSFERSTADPCSSTSFFVDGVLLALLTIQTATAAVLGKVAKDAAAQTATPFIPSTAVFVAECFKLVLSMIWLACITPSTSNSQRTIEAQGTTQSNADAPTATRGRLVSMVAFTRQNMTWISFLSTAVPAIVYAFQNNLAWLAMAYLDPVLFLILNQLKTLFTALLSVVFLETRLSRVQVLALFNLVLGVVLAQMPHQAPDCSKCAYQQLTVQQQQQQANAINTHVSVLFGLLNVPPLTIGIGAALLMTMSSAVAGV
jgi:drug/metabolite transporter (DMT)-like permease